MSWKGDLIFTEGSSLAKLSSFSPPSLWSSSYSLARKKISSNSGQIYLHILHAKHPINETEKCFTQPKRGAHLSSPSLSPNTTGAGAKRMGGTGG
jgi:hypothetical protein